MAGPIVPGLPQPLGLPNGIAKPVPGQIGLWAVWSVGDATTGVPTGGGSGPSPPAPPASDLLLCVTGDLPITLASTAEGLPVYIRGTLP